MIDSMREIELAYNLLKSEGDAEEDPFDKHYKKLKTDIQPLDKNSEEYKMVEKYTKNTHAATHSYYKLKIDQVRKTCLKLNQKHNFYCTLEFSTPVLNFVFIYCLVRETLASHSTYLTSQELYLIKNMFFGQKWKNSALNLCNIC